MIGEIGEVVFAVQIGAAQIDPEAAGDAAVLAARAAIGTRRTDFLGGRDAAHLHVRIDQRVEGARHLRLDPLDPLGDEIHDLGAARVALGEFVARVGSQRLHAFAHRTAGIADAAQDRVHARMQRFKFLEALPVNLIGGQARGRARTQRPGIEFLAMRARGHARRIAGDRAFGAQFLELAGQRFGDRSAFQCQRAIGVALGHARGLQLGAQIAGEQFALARAGDGLFHLAQRLVEQEGWRHHAHAARLADPRQFAFERGGHRFQAFDIGVGIVAMLNLVVRLHEARQRQIFADVLDHHIGRGAPIADRRIAIGQRKAVEREFIGAFDDIEAGHRRAVETIARLRAHPVEILPERRGISGLARGRLVFELAAQAVVAAGIHPQRGRPFGFVREQIVADHFEQALRTDRLRAGDRRGPRGGGASREGEGGGRAKAGKGLAAGDGGAGLGHARGCASRVQACQINRGIRAGPCRHWRPTRS